MRASELERWQSRQGEIVNAHARVGGELRELVIPSAIPDSVVDNFEESIYEDQDKSLSDVYNGALAEYDRNTNSPVFEGDYSLKTGDNTINELIWSTSGLPRYPQAGEMIRSRHHLADVTDNQNLTLCFGVQDGDNFYMARWEESSGQLQLFVVSNGSFSELASTAANPPFQEWLRLDVDWGSDGSITVELYDESVTLVGSISASDSSYTSGGIGFRNARTVATDLVEIVE